MDETFRLRAIALVVLVAVAAIGFVAGRLTAETPRVEYPSLYVDPLTGCHFLIMDGRLYRRPHINGTQVCGGWPAPAPGGV